ncbi:RDD domain-containing protein [Candidatus Nitrosoglobus terrae]|uniref:RDD domain-containing protein n=1 Tax=Candidatus Nitrosoglobus terrae TaxID=1630141 RepID=A0A1Q2SMV7_9GAMM|nr:RDD family protein [Candidatus Nitrosoglobus terrae]BAW80452.1 RDD domain-containing protein [Candidatus Nitrosoglobus terrae]
MKATNHQTSFTPGLFRRLGAIFYDGLLLAATWFVFTILILPLTGGKAIAAGNILYRLYLLLIAFIFFGGFWTHGGQTLGMRAWHLKVQQPNGGTITWLQALFRFGLALISWVLLGAGFWWILIDKEKKAWHDRFSKTELTLISKTNTPGAT